LSSSGTVSDGVLERRRPSFGLPLAALGALLLAVLAELGRFYFLDTFDRPLVLALNAFAQASHLFDRAMQMIQGFHTFKGVVAFTIVFAAFATNPDVRKRVRLVIGCAAAALAAGCGRGLQILLPNSARPKFDPDLAWSPPYGGSEAMRDWSSFPSDHATLLFGVTCAILLVDRRLGLLMLAAAVLANFARVYTGLHYPTDIVGGALLGCAFVCAAVALADRVAISDRFVAWTGAHRGWLAAGGFFLAVQAATLFEEPREIATTMAKVLGF
jgi:membrane-associated phospholipid phosphatase